MAECSKCESREDLLVWYTPDPYTGYPLLLELICSTCPPPDNVFVDSTMRYDPDVHDIRFGLSDYHVPLSYWFFGGTDVRGVCFACDGEINMSEDGYGACYIPKKYRRDRDHCQVAYCKICFKERRKRHVDDVEESELCKLDVYWTKTLDNGRQSEPSSVVSSNVM